MSERYWITGVQLGLLMTVGSNAKNRLINEIIDEQFIGNFQPKEFKKKIKENLNNRGEKKK